MKDSLTDQATLITREHIAAVARAIPIAPVINTLRLIFRFYSGSDALRRAPRSSEACGHMVDLFSVEPWH
jgi:hypothetical protein